MDLTTIIIGIVLLLAFVIPITIAVRRQKNNKQKLENELAAIGQANQMNISEKEAWKNKVIGLDRQTNKVLFLVRKKPVNEVVVVDLKEYAKCEASRGSRSVESGGKNQYQVVTAVSLRFIPRERTKPDQQLLLYNDDIDFPLDAELRIAEEWADSLNTIMRKMPKTEPAAAAVS